MCSSGGQFNELDISNMLSLWFLLHGLTQTLLHDIVSFVTYGLMIAGVTSGTHGNALAALTYKHVIVHRKQDCYNYSVSS